MPRSAPASSDPIEAIRHQLEADACRILILGSPGSGKTVFSKALAAATGLPLHHLDDLHWGSQWTRPEAERWLALQCIVAAGPAWIIDGTYLDTLEVRMRRATAVILLDLPTWRCLLGIVRRSCDRLVGRRESLPRRVRAGAPIRWRGLQWRLIRKVLTFRMRARRAILAQTRAALEPGRLILVRNRSQLAALIKALGKPSAVAASTALTAWRKASPC